MFVLKPRFLLGFLAACLAAQSHAQVVRVGSKNFTEQFIVAEVYAQALENAGIKAQTRTNLGATLIAHAALLNGDIDLYPEYTGTAMAHVVKGDLSGSAEQTYETVKSYYEKNLHLTLLQPTHINNGYAIVVLPETAVKYKLRTLSDLGPASRNLSFGAEGSFADRSDGLPGMSRVYGIHFKPSLWRTHVEEHRCLVWFHHGLADRGGQTRGARR
jgi:osmoprotectant transport system substrate-binding protein